MGAERTCIACRTRRGKADLVRVVRIPGGRVEVDASGRSPGRGAYVCREQGCVERGPGALGRALRVPLGPDDLARLGTEMERELE